MYAGCFKRVIDFLLSLFALIVLSPLLLILMILGAVFMRGNPFFIQARPGKDEKIFKLIKFRSMDNRKDKHGELLPDNVRLNRYGRILRATSLDELPQLINILKGDMSFVGPRPLVVSYLPYYTEEERHRHDVRPGLTGLAQVNGRKDLRWDEQFAFDIQYVNNLSLGLDIFILFKTAEVVLKGDGTAQGGGMRANLYDERQAKEENDGKRIQSV